MPSQHYVLIRVHTNVKEALDREAERLGYKSANGVLGAMLEVESATPHKKKAKPTT